MLMFNVNPEALDHFYIFSIVVGIQHPAQLHGGLLGGHGQHQAEPGLLHDGLPGPETLGQEAGLQGGSNFIHVLPLNITEKGLLYYSHDRNI